MLPKHTRSILAGLVFALISTTALAQRERTRPTADQITPVTDSQATALTLTVSQVAVRPIQTWVRTAGAIAKDGRTLTATVQLPDGALVKAGQRVRAFPPEARSSMYQAKVVRVTRQGSAAVVEAILQGPARQNSKNYVMEVLVDHGDYLSVPNEAIIEEGDKRVVYMQMKPGQYMAHEIQTGLQGELYTHVKEGIGEGDQIVTIGSFFIDSEMKLKSSGSTGHDQHSH
jgi:Cu(I)/Ag(I) efflux system membrane fusion protein